MAMYRAAIQSSPLLSLYLILLSLLLYLFSHASLSPPSTNDSLAVTIVLEKERQGASSVEVMIQRHELE